MRWTLRLGAYRGIDVYLHATFLLLLVFLGASNWLATRSLTAALLGVGLIMLLFFFVLLHEFGHALTAARFGIRTRDIVLYPIGGVARLERMPRDPRQELLVALAGPAVNLVIALGLLLWLSLADGLAPLAAMDWTRGPLLLWLLAVNVVLLVFNLIPAFPMDGGRVLRALLAMRLDYTKATRIAAVIGQAMALVFGLVGLVYGRPLLVLIAFFVWMGAAQESRMVQRESGLGGVLLRRVMTADVATVDAQERLARAVQITLSGSQRDVPVLDHGRVVGMLRQEDILRALHEQGPATRVIDAMQREFPTADVREPLPVVLRRLSDSRWPALAVLDEQGRFMGLVTMQGVGESLRGEAG